MIALGVNCIVLIAAVLCKILAALEKQHVAPIAEKLCFTRIWYASREHHLSIINNNNCICLEILSTVV